MAETRTSPGSRPDTAGVTVGLLSGILVAAAFVAILNETALSNALPSLMREFQVGEDVAQWLTTVFMLTMAVVIPTTGYLMQRLTLRTIYIVALSLFLGGTVLAAVARHLRPGGFLVVGCRVVRGFTPADLDVTAGPAMLTLAQRFTTWDLRPWSPDAEFCVSVLRRNFAKP